MRHAMGMVRTTLMLPEILRRKGRAEARRRGIAFSALIRESLRAELARMPPRDSMLDDRAFYKGPAPADCAINHDEYLYGEKP